MSMSPVVLVPHVLLREMLRAVWLLDKQASAAFEIPQETYQGGSLIPVFVGRAEQILVQGELLYPGVVLLHFVKDWPFTYHVRQDLFLQEGSPTLVDVRFVVRCHVEPSACTSELPFFS